MAKKMIDDSFYDDEWINSLSINERYYFQYLLVNTKANLAGIYQISLSILSANWEISKHQVLEILRKFEDARKCYYIDNYIILPNYPKFQTLTNKYIRIGMESIIRKLSFGIILKLIEVGYNYDLYSINMNYEELVKYNKIKSHADKYKLEFKEVLPPVITLIDFIKSKQNLLLTKQTMHNELKMIVNGTSGIKDSFEHDKISDARIITDVTTQQNNAPVFTDDPTHDYTDDIKQIIKLWNSLNLVKVRNSLAPNFVNSGEILNCFKDFGVDEISLAIKNYAFILDSEKHHATAFSSLQNFLKSPDAVNLYSQTVIVMQAKEINNFKKTNDKKTDNSEEIARLLADTKKRDEEWKNDRKQ